MTRNSCTVPVFSLMFSAAMFVANVAHCQIESHSETDGHQNESRQWSDDSGQFNVSAILLGLSNGHVELLKSNSDEIRVPLKRLSKDDRRYVAIAFRKMHLAKEKIEALELQQESEFQPKSDAKDAIGDQAKDAPDFLLFDYTLQDKSEWHLSTLLADYTPELDLYRTDDRARQLLGSLDEDRDEDDVDYDILSPRDFQHDRLFADRSDLVGLPRLMNADYKISPYQAQALGHISQFLSRGTEEIKRSAIFRARDPVDARRLVEDDLIDRRDQRVISNVRKLRVTGTHAVAGLDQVLQADTPRVRRHLVEMLSRIPGPRSSAALAKRAVFDLDAENRTVAIQALKNRPATEFRSIILAAFNYPWVPAAQHAAEALVLMDDQGAIEPLIDLLGNRNPHWPRMRSDGSYAVRELVKVNHMRNCLLCHAPSTNKIDLVRGRIPYPNERLPREYYHSNKGSYVRADVTYIRQDFSLTQPVKNSGEWPEMQRHDYFVRHRTVSAAEANQLVQHLQQESNPYREAILFALRRLTKRDPGESTEAWQQLAAM